MEFAEALPIILFLTVGALDLGRLIYSQMVITNAAREGAYYLISHPTDKDTMVNGAIAAATAEAQNSGVPQPGFQVTVNSCCTANQSVSVVVQACITNLPLLSWIKRPDCSGNGILITKTISMMFPQSFLR